MAEHGCGIRGEGVIRREAVMNPVSVGLTVAWLDAFREMGTQKTLLDETKLPDGERTLSETIASALRVAGAEREEYVDPAAKTEAAQSSSGAVTQIVDKLA
jgi:hypothetical protein